MKITKEGQGCRKCGSPVIRKFPKAKAKRQRQPYYFKSYLFCPGCKTMYMVESEKVYADGREPVESQKFDESGYEKSILFMVFREVLNRNKVAPKIQQEMWEELENELGRVIN